jgi:hypothetical protein
MLIVVILTPFFYWYAESRYAKCHHTERRYSECCNCKCRGACLLPSSQIYEEDKIVY